MKMLLAACGRDEWRATAPAQPDAHIRRNNTNRNRSGARLDTVCQQYSIWCCGRVQAEQRTFWDAPEVYAAMAPFNNAHKIQQPLLLVHGEADNNTGARTVLGPEMQLLTRLDAVMCANVALL